MKNHRIHFIWDKTKKPDDAFATNLVDALGQSSYKNAKKIVVIGGDGMLLHTLGFATGKYVAGLVSPGSASTGFWTNKGINNADELLALLKKSNSYELKPLKIKAKFQDGTSETHYAFNDCVIQPAPQEATPKLRESFSLASNILSLQSLSLDVSVQFNHSSIRLQPILGSGLVFSTALGSTAKNMVMDGPSLDIRHPAIIMTGLGNFRPQKDIGSVFNDESTVFDVRLNDISKRPGLVTFDSFALKENREHSPLTQVRISTADNKSVHLVLNDNPGTRAYAHLIAER